MIAVVYANPDKLIEKAYGVWLRALLRNATKQNIGARWLRNGGDGGQAWSGVVQKIILVAVRAEQG